MTDRERRWSEFERSHTSLRRILTLAVIVTIGVLLGSSRTLDPGPSFGVATASVDP